jgi:hypothetical protein
METRLIKLNLEKDQELYEEPMSAMMEHRQYNGCYIMQYQEHRGDELQMVGEFLLRVPVWRGFFSQGMGRGAA